MTWLIAQPVIFGYSIMLADVCVSLVDQKTQEIKHEYDCLRKIYSLDRRSNFVVGFAGDVETGFKLVANIQKYLGRMLDVLKRPLEPKELIDGWVEVVKSELDISEPTSLTVIGVSMTESNGLDGRGMEYAFKVSFPGTDVEAARPGVWLTSGSGSDVNELRELIAAPDAPWHPLLKGEVHNPFGYASMMATHINYEMLSNGKRHSGISNYMQLAISSREGVELRDFSAQQHKDDGEVVDYPPPEKLCKNYSELDTYLSSKGVSLRGLKARATHTILIRASAQNRFKNT